MINHLLKPSPIRRSNDSNTIDGDIDQLKELYSQFDHLSDSEKGELIDYTIGKYGIDIFAGSVVIGGAIKGGKVLISGASAYHKLKNVNRACNLEAMTISSANKEKIVAESLKHAAERKNYFKNVRSHWDKHNKHIIGSHDYEPDEFRSIYIRGDSEKLLQEFAGKGIAKNNFIPGTAEYVERVDFGELIGYYLGEKIQQ